MTRFHNYVSETKLSQEQAAHILETAEVGNLAMTSGNWPYCVPVNFAYANGDIYIHSSIKGKKIEHIKANPPVCFSVLGDFEYKKGECNYAFESVIVYGKAWIIKDANQKRRAYEALVAKYEPDGKYDPDEACNAMSSIIVIEIDEITGKKKAQK